MDDIRLEAARTDRRSFASSRPWPFLILRQQLVGDLHFAHPDDPDADPHEGSTLIHVPRVSASERVHRPLDPARKALLPERWCRLVPAEGRDWMVIGRDRGSDLQLPDYTVSAEHARIHLVATTPRAWIEDVGARNSTAHNGVLLHPGQRIQLMTGDEVVIGSNVLLFLDAPDFHRYLRGEL